MRDLRAAVQVVCPYSRRSDCVPGLRAGSRAGTWTARYPRADAATQGFLRVTAVWITLGYLGGTAVTRFLGYPTFVEALWKHRRARTGSLDDFRHITNNEKEAA